MGGPEPLAGVLWLVLRTGGRFGFSSAANNRDQMPLKSYAPDVLSAVRLIPGGQIQGAEA